MHYVFVPTFQNEAVACTRHVSTGTSRGSGAQQGVAGAACADPGVPWGRASTSSAAAFRTAAAGRRWAPRAPSGTALAEALGRVGEHPEGARREAPGRRLGQGAGARAKRGSSPRPRIVRRSFAGFITFVHSLLSDFLLSPFQHRLLYFSSQPGCFISFLSEVPEKVLFSAV